MKTELIKIDPKEFGLEEQKTKTIEQAFLPKVTEREGYLSIYNDLLKKEINESTCKEAGDLRRKLVKVRTGIAAIHKTEKAYHLAAGRYVDALKNKLTEPVTQMEEKLSEIEKYYENQEKERLAKLQAKRVDELSKYVDGEITIDLSYMGDDVWEAYVTAKKNAYEERIKAEKKAEEERIAKEKAEAEERERIRKENERLKKEAEEKEKARLAELEAIKAKQEAERKERERLAKIEAEEKAAEEARQKALDKAGENRRELLFNIGISLDFQTCRDMDEKTWGEFYREKNDKYQAEQNRLHLQKLKEEKERKEKEAKLLAEQKKAEEQKAKLEAQLKAKEEAERKAKEAEEARLQAELNKGDAAKVKDLIADLEALKAKYTFKSAKNKKMYADVGLLIDKVVSHINK